MQDRRTGQRQGAARDLLGIIAIEEHGRLRYRRATSKHVDVTEARGDRRLRDRRICDGLAPCRNSSCRRGNRLSLVAQSVEQVPELRCPPLISGLCEHLAEPAVPDLVEKLAAELEIMALLIDARSCRRR